MKNMLPKVLYSQIFEKNNVISVQSRGLFHNIPCSNPSVCQAISKIVSFGQIGK